VVLLGDSSKPDPVKPYVISIKGYEFIFLEKLKAKTDIVFNLCDEGFQNDLRKELHNTGSPPHCLAICYDKSMVRAIAKEFGRYEI